MQMLVWKVLAILSWTLAIAGCEKGAPAPEPDHAQHDHSQHQHDQAPEPKADQPAGPRIETGSFLLAVAPAQPKYAAGQAGELEIALESRGEWHVNQEYPIRVDLKAASGVALPKAELVKDDAKEFGEEKVRFLAPIEPSTAGKHEVTCDVSFAMCTEENCILERRTVAMELEVQ
jgi:hypothetical protein